MHIIEDDLTHPDVRELIRLHLIGMRANSPACNVFALDIDGLRSPGVTFWSVWDGDEVMGCGAMKELDPGHGEVKSMRTADAYLKRGVAAAVLDHIISTARSRGYARLSLETGRGDYFEPAHRLYRRTGFVECGPFANYADTEFSVYYSLDLGAEGPPVAVTSLAGS